MSFKRGEVWIASLDPIKGSEQGGMRPVIIFQEDTVSQFTNTVITIPLTTNLKRISLPTCVLINAPEGGLSRDSVALCHQLRVLDITRLRGKIGEVNSQTIANLESIVWFTLGYQF